MQEAASVRVLYCLVLAVADEVVAVALGAQMCEALSVTCATAAMQAAASV
jgi:hypothetical protein